jgi:hypothetical protein
MNVNVVVVMSLVKDASLVWYSVAAHWVAQRLGLDIQSSKWTTASPSSFCLDMEVFLSISPQVLLLVAPP